MDEEGGTVRAGPPSSPLGPHEWFWQDRAACKDAPEEDKHAFTSIPRRVVTDDLVERYCDRCPVVAQCADWAERDRPFVGVAGGRAWMDHWMKKRKQQ